MKRSISHATLISLGALACILVGMSSPSAGEVREADRLVHKALKDRTKTFCRSVLPAWFRQKDEKNIETFRTLVADCYLGHARLAVLGVGSRPFFRDVGLSDLPSALLVRETGMSLDVYRPLAGRTIKDFTKSE